MVTDKNPEPVPAATQLALLPFLAAVEGFLKKSLDEKSLRITMHRTMVREKKGYLQQACAYLGIKDKDWRTKVGRIFPVNVGIIGAAYETSKIFRTKFYSSEKALKEDLAKDMAQTGDKGDIEKRALSYLAVPFLGPENQVVLILYAESGKLNLFADDDRVRQIHAMCDGLCGLYDWLQGDPFANLRNFSLEPGEPMKGERTVYPLLQEPVETLSPPRFTKLRSFNYETSIR